MIRVALILATVALCSGCIHMAILGAVTNAAQTYQIYELEQKLDDASR